MAICGSQGMIPQCTVERQLRNDGVAIVGQASGASAWWPCVVSALAYRCRNGSDRAES